jgi:hypothetical protein
MNVLIFVTTILMLLSLMTYARLETYRNSQAFQSIFKHYMQETERGVINGQAQTVYESIVVKEDDKKGETKKNPAIDANPRIAIGLLFDPTRDSQVKDWEQTKILLKNLIETLYDKQPFYQKIHQQRPVFIDELINAIMKTVDDLPAEKKPKKTTDLGNLKLLDPVLDDALYKILHGAPNLNVVTYEQKRVEQQNDSNKFSEDDIATTGENVESGQESDTYQSPGGYYSLLDYVTGKKKPKIRIYLAPRNVLLAIFKDETTVDTIINERESLYRQAVDSEKMEPFNESFKNQFEKLRDQAIDPETLNFSVSKTNPKYYR